EAREKLTVGLTWRIIAQAGPSFEAAPLLVQASGPIRLRIRDQRPLPCRHIAAPSAVSDYWRPDDILRQGQVDG
ncbi:MAG: hypothetical protein N2B05_11120, partial [Gemmatimonadales bacterium]